MEQAQNKSKRPLWMSDETVKDIDIRKLEFIQELHDNASGATQKELMMKLMPKLKYAKEQGYTTLFLDTRITLEPAVSIYRSFGFDIVFQQGLYIQMEKKI